MDRSERHQVRISREKNSTPTVFDSAILLALTTGALYMLGVFRTQAFLLRLGLPDTLSIFSPQGLVTVGFGVLFQSVIDILFSRPALLALVACLLIVCWISVLRIAKLGAFRTHLSQRLSGYRKALFLIAIFAVYFALITASIGSGNEWADEVLSGKNGHQAVISLKAPTSRELTGHVIAETDGLFIILTGSGSQYVPRTAAEDLVHHLNSARVVIINKDEISEVRIL